MYRKTEVNIVGQTLSNNQSDLSYWRRWRPYWLCLFDTLESHVKAPPVIAPPPEYKPFYLPDRDFIPVISPPLPEYKANLMYECVPFKYQNFILPQLQVISQSDLVNKSPYHAAGALKKNIFFDVDIVVKKNKSKCGFSKVLGQRANRVIIG